MLEAAFGRAQGYVNQYFTKASYKFDVLGNPLTTSYQFYGAEDRISDKNDPNSIYDGGTAAGADLRLHHRPIQLASGRHHGQGGRQRGFFLQRMTPTYASSNGRLDVWWDNRSDFNANGEKAVYAGVMYDLSNWNLPGMAVGGSYVYAQDAKPSTNPIYDQSQRLKESAGVWTRCTPSGKGAPRAP